jgi:hypothetical protein
LLTRRRRCGQPEREKRGLAAATTHTTGFPATTRLLAQPAAALVLAGYATIALLTGAALLKRRDITT